MRARNFYALGSRNRIDVLLLRGLQMRDSQRRQGVNFLNEKRTKAKYLGVEIVVVERGTREHSRAYVTAVPREHSAIYAQETSR